MNKNADWPVAQWQCRSNQPAGVPHATSVKKLSKKVRVRETYN
jgi:hypothetical protein